jgi:hypothetical protein
MEEITITKIMKNRIETQQSQLYKNKILKNRKKNSPTSTK